MATLYGRSAWVYVDSLQVSGLRLKFKAEKTLKVDPNTLDLVIYNLKAATRARMQTKGAKVVLVAGYQGTEQVLFSGLARTIDHRHEGPEWETHIQCGDGEVDFRKAYSSASFGPGVKWQDVAMSLAGDLYSSVGDALRGVKGDTDGKVDRFLQGYTVGGPTTRELDRLSKAVPFEWSIQDGALQITKPGKATAETAVLLSSNTGMVGSPDHGTPEKDGTPSLLKVKSLLNAGVRPGRKVSVDSFAVKGTYRVEKVSHEGDTHGPEWYSTIEALPL